MNATKGDNGVGFNRDDSYILSMYAKYIVNRTNLPEGKKLTPGEMLVARERIKKYCGQILEEIISRNKKP